MADYVSDIATLQELYGPPGEASLRKVARRLTPLYHQWIMASRFCVVSTVGAQGTDGSPRGDDGPVVQAHDAGTLLLPDWRGNNRMDTLRNIVEDGRISLMFMVTGSDTVVRVNGRARVSLSQALIARFSDRGRLPRSVVVIKIAEIYAQCARAPMRAGLWRGGDESPDLPTVGEILAEQTAGAQGGADYDANWLARAEKTLW